MGIFSTTLNQMAFLFSLIALGFILAKLKAVPKDASETLAKLENNIFIPALVMGTFIDNFTVASFNSAWKLFLISCVIGLVMIVLALLVGKLCSRNDEYIRRIYTYGLSFANFGFMGNAVVNALFPDIFMEYLIFTLPLWMMIYIWAVPSLLIFDGSEKNLSIGTRMKSLLNPMFVCMLIGIVIGLSGIELPGFVKTLVSVSGDCMSPVAMILTGIAVAESRMKEVLVKWDLYVVCFVRLLVFPLLFVALMALVPIPETIAVCAVCSLAMPLGLNTIVIPSAYGRDTSVASGMTLVSHVLSGGTIPLVMYLMMKFI